MSPVRGFFRFIAAAVSMLLFSGATAVAQDTVYVSMKEFVDQAAKRSAVLKLRAIEITIAENRANQAAATRWIPKLDLTTNHGLVPGIKTDSSRNRAFLDPNLENDWSKWSIFSRVEFQGIQPIFTWGAISNGVSAAREAVKAASFDYDNSKTEFELRLKQLYFAKQLDIRLRGILRNADEQFEKAEKTLQRMQDDGEDVEQSQIYRFKISRLQFSQKRLEFEEQMSAVDRIWKAALGFEGDSIIAIPTERELKLPVEVMLDFDYFRNTSIVSRPDLKSIRMLRSAADKAYQSKKAQLLPALFFGFGGEFVSTPRPVQQQPLIGDRYLYANLYYTIGFRQSLNFGVLRYDVNRSLIDLKKANEAENALKEGALLELAENYRTVKTLHGKVASSQQALQISKEWVRLEQIDYDLGVGELRNLVEAVRSNLELDAETAKLLYDLNVEYARLLRSAGLAEQP
jgi:outer membrane protein TolC